MVIVLQPFLIYPELGLGTSSVNPIKMSQSTSDVLIYYVSSMIVVFVTGITLGAMKIGELRKTVLVAISLPALIILISVSVFDADYLDLLPIPIILSLIILSPKILSGFALGFNKPFLKDLLVYFLLSIIILPAALIGASYTKSSILDRQNMEIKSSGYAPAVDFSVMRGKSKCPLFIIDKSMLKKELNKCWYDKYAVVGEIHEIEKYYVSAMHGSFSSSMFFFVTLYNSNSESLSKAEALAIRSEVRHAITKSMNYTNRLTGAEFYDVEKYLERLDNVIDENTDFSKWTGIKNLDQPSELSLRLKEIKLKL
jgi:hypothetical protein